MSISRAKGLNAYSREQAEFRIEGTVAKGQTFLSAA